MFTVKQITIILNKYNKLYVKIEKFTNKNERKDNIISILPIFIKQYIAINFTIQNNLIYTDMICDKCGVHMNLINDTSRKLGKKWYCYNCNISRSILYGSVLYCAKISIEKIFYLLYCWVYGYSCKLTSHETDVHINTVTYYFTLFRNACDSFVISCNKCKIGGKTVQIDETLICRRKFNVGRVLNQVWIFGGICIEDHQFFCLPVINRTTETLSEEIKNYILPGTTIISDCWKAYDYLNTSNEYTHLTVDHSKNFVNPVDGSNTQTIERMWRELKKINKKYEGIPKNKINEHVSEFIWRYNILKNAKNKFIAAVVLIAEIQFLKVKDME